MRSAMYVKPRHLGCCSTGPAAFGADLPSVSTVTTTPDAPAAEPAWGKLFLVSVAAGLALTLLTKRKK